MENEAELIREQMLETRTSLTEKLETLEEQVTAKVKDTTESVVETVETVKDAVESTVHTVKDTVQDTVETVKETFNLSHQVEEHPWMMMGGAVVLGYVGGRLLNSGMGQGYGTGVGMEPRRETGPPMSAYAAPPQPSLTDKALHALSPVLSKLGSLAVGVTTGLIAEMVRESTPETMRGQVNEVLDELTHALGGTPVRLSSQSREYTGQQV